MPTFVQILDFIGTFAFAISGIRLASAKRFDWFGAYVVGFVTAIGGGTIRHAVVQLAVFQMFDEKIRVKCAVIVEVMAAGTVASLEP